MATLPTRAESGVTYSWFKTHSTSPPGRRLTLPYSMYSYHGTSTKLIPGGRGMGCDTAVARCYTALSTKMAGSDSDVMNKCLSKVVDTLRDGAEIGATLAESRQSMDMMTGRLRSLADFTRNLRRGSIGGALSSLADGGNPMAMRDARVKNATWRSRSKYPANNWLEWHFGWDPLIKDIYAAIDVMTKPLPPMEIKERAGMYYETSFSSNQIIMPGTCGGTYPVDGSVSTSESASITRRAQVGVKVRISNPNLSLANRLGLVNPVAVAWELVPYSFVVDWFSTVGQCINSMSDFAGYQILDSYNTRIDKLRYSFFERSDWFRCLNPEAVIQSDKFSGIKMSRAAGVPSPVLKLRPLKAWSVSRGATAASLLAQQLEETRKSKPRRP